MAREKSTVSSSPQGGLLFRHPIRVNNSKISGQKSFIYRKTETRSRVSSGEERRRKSIDIPAHTPSLWQRQRKQRRHARYTCERRCSFMRVVPGRLYAHAPAEIFTVRAEVLSRLDRTEKYSHHHFFLQPYRGAH